MFEGLARTAVAMEQAGVIHGDMQAGNLLFGANDTDYFRIHPTSKLSDFGSARLVSTLPNDNRLPFLDDHSCQEYTAPVSSKSVWPM